MGLELTRTACHTMRNKERASYCKSSGICALNTGVSLLKPALVEMIQLSTQA